MPEAEPLRSERGLGSDVNAVIAECGGDARAAVRALIVANTFLAAEVETMLQDMSRGYSRGRHLPPTNEEN